MTQQELDDQSRQLDEQAATFLSILTFELRTPLSAILGYSHLLKDKWESIPETEKVQMINEIEKSARYLVEIVHDTTDINKMGLDLLQLDFQELNLVEVIQEVISARSQSFKNYHPPIEVEQLLPDGLPLIWADRLRIFQIFDKLLLTLVKNTKSGKITMEVNYDENWITISLRTIGESITTDIKGLPRTPTIWRMPNQDWDLGISRYLVEKHGGQLEIRNQEGKGPMIVLTLPIKLIQ